MPTEIAATCPCSGFERSTRRSISTSTASASATKPPVIAAVRVPPSACRTSQSIVTVRSPKPLRSTTARKARPIKRCISWVRPVCLPRAASRAERVWVARGSMPYSAVTQPCCCPRRNDGTVSSTLAVQSTRVSPKLTSTEPSACLVKERWKATARSSSGARPLGLVLTGPASAARQRSCYRCRVRRPRPPACRDAHLRQRGVAAETAFDVISHRMTLYLGFRDQSFAQQYLHVAVVARALEHLLLSQLIDATVADVRPIGRGILDQADRTGRARPRFNTESHAQLDDLFVCPPERQMQKAERIENRMRCLPKRLEQRCESRFSGTRTLGVATHAVDDREQHRIVVARNRDAVLIFFAVPDEAHVRGFDLQLLLLRLLLNLGTIFVELGRLCRKPPMIRSMTGFARRERQFPWGMLAWELKTVNHRFLEIGCRLPEEFRSAESEFRAAVSASVRRGKVDCSLFYRATIASSGLEVDAA